MRAVLSPNPGQGRTEKVPRWAALVPVYPQVRTSPGAPANFRLCAKNGPEQVQERTTLLDHLVGVREQTGGYLYTKRLGGLEIDHKLVLGRRLYRKVTGLLALEDAIDVARGSTELIEEIRPVGDQSPGSNIIAFLKYGGQL